MATTEAWETVRAATMRVGDITPAGTVTALDYYGALRLVVLTIAGQDYDRGFDDLIDREIRSGDPDTGPACPEVYTVTVHGGRAGAYTATVAGRDGNLLPDGATATGPTIVDAMHELLTTWTADLIQWTMDHEHELPAVCPHGRTAAERTITPCTVGLAGCVIP